METAKKSDNAEVFLPLGVRKSFTGKKWTRFLSWNPKLLLAVDSHISSCCLLSLITSFTFMDETSIVVSRYTEKGTFIRY